MAELSWIEFSETNQPVISLGLEADSEEADVALTPTGPVDDGTRD